MKLKLSRLQTIMLLVRNMALEESKFERSLMALQTIDLLETERTEQYLINYYKGL